MGSGTTDERQRHTWLTDRHFLSMTPLALDQNLKDGKLFYHELGQEAAVVGEQLPVELLAEGREQEVTLEGRADSAGGSRSQMALDRTSKSSLMGSLEQHMATSVSQRLLPAPRAASRWAMAGHQALCCDCQRPRRQSASLCPRKTFGGSGKWTGAWSFGENTAGQQ